MIVTPASRNSAEEAAARIGDRVSSVRSARNVRVSELARQTGVSSSLISQIERGHSRPSVATLFALARALDVPVDTFFADPADQDTVDGGTQGADGPGSVSSEPGDAPAAASVATDAASAGSGPPMEFPTATATPTRRAGRDRHVVRQDQRASIDIRGGVRWERLTPTALDGVEFLELVYAPGAESDRQSYRHPGVELVLVTKGVMTICLGFDRHDLEPGDSIAFPSSTPHRYFNATDTEARAITVILRDDLSTLPLREEGAGEPADGDGA